MKKIAIILIAVFLLCLTSCDFEALAELASLSINSSSNLSNSVASELVGTKWKCTSNYYYINLNFTSTTRYYASTNSYGYVDGYGSWYLSSIESTTLSNGNIKYYGYIYLKPSGNSSYNSNSFSYYPGSGCLYIGNNVFYKD